MNSMMRLEVLRKAIKEAVDHKKVEGPILHVFQSFLDGDYNAIKNDLLLLDDFLTGFAKDTIK